MPETDYLWQRNSVEQELEYRVIRTKNDPHKKEIEDSKKNVAPNFTPVDPKAELQRINYANHINASSIGPAEKPSKYSQAYISTVSNPPDRKLTHSKEESTAPAIPAAAQLVTPAVGPAKASVPEVQTQKIEAVQAKQEEAVAAPIPAEQIASPSVSGNNEISAPEALPPLTPLEKELVEKVIGRLLDSIDIEKKSIHDNIDAIFRVFMLINSVGHRLDRSYLLNLRNQMNEMAEEIAKKQKGKEWIGYVISGCLQIVGGVIGGVAGISYPLLNPGINPMELANLLQPASMVSQGVGSVGGGTNTVTEIFSKRVQATVELKRHYQTTSGSKSDDRRANDREDIERIESSRRSLEQLLNALHDTISRMLASNSG